LKLKLERYDFGPNYTVGKLYIDGKYFCYTLEDVLRHPGAAKVDGATCIPAGTYKTIIDRSMRFKRDMPHVLDVPGFSGIRIHCGNTDKDTEGCILLGLTHEQGQDFIGNSVKAYGTFFPILQAALRLKEIVTLEIV